jgi:hypothetical protein
LDHDRNPGSRDPSPIPTHAEGRKQRDIHPCEWRLP